jgi:hypothetical protein
MINSSKKDSAYIYVESGDMQGNAVIVFKIGTFIYWSYHLWVTDYDPYQAAGQKLFRTDAAIANVFMDRNLGAMNNKYDAAGEARGFYYQFGRKDPLPHSTGWLDDGITTGYAQLPAEYAYYLYPGPVQSALAHYTTSTYTITSLRPRRYIQEWIRYPNYFWYANMSYQVLSEEHNNLWNTPGGNKTAQDPCPEGWRVPVQTENGPSYSPWYGLTTSNFPYYATSASDYYWGRYNPEIGYWPLSGMMLINTPGVQYYNLGQTGRYFTSYVDPSSYSESRPAISGALSITQTDVTINFNGGTESMGKVAWHVRCVVDKRYLQNHPDGGLFVNGNAHQLKQQLNVP